MRQEGDGHLIPVVTSFLVLFAICLLGMPGAGGGDGRHQPDNQGSDGCWSFVTLLEEHGFVPRHEATSFLNLGDETLRIHFNPLFTPREEERLAQWVGEGHNLLLLIDDECFFDTLKVRVVSRHRSNSTTDTETTTAVIEGLLSSAEVEEEIAEIARPADLPSLPLEGVRALSLKRSRVVTSPYGLLPLLTVGGKTAAALLPVGRGTVAIVGSGFPATNEGLVQEDNGLFLLQLVSQLCPDKVVHLAQPGWGRGPAGVTSLLWTTPARKWALLHILFVGVLCLVSLGARRRPVAVVSSVGRRGPRQYVEAMADLLRSGQATGPALDELRETFLMDVRRRWGRFEPARPLACTPLLHYLGRDRLEDLGRLLEEMRSQGCRGRPSQKTAYGLARRLAAIRKELSVS